MEDSMKHSKIAAGVVVASVLALTPFTPAMAAGHYHGGHGHYGHHGYGFGWGLAAAAAAIVTAPIVIASAIVGPHYGPGPGYYDAPQASYGPPPGYMQPQYQYAPQQPYQYAPQQPYQYAPPAQYPYAPPARYPYAPPQYGYPQAEGPNGR
jgi:hypothetical protein